MIQAVECKYACKIQGNSKCLNQVSYIKATCWRAGSFTIPPHIRHKIDSMSALERRSNAHRFKHKGNDHIRAKSYAEAILDYGSGLAVANSDDTEVRVDLHANRALAWTKLAKWTDAIEDCNAVLQQQPDHLKALMRRGTAKAELKNFSGALADAKAALIQVCTASDFFFTLFERFLVNVRSSSRRPRLCSLRPAHQQCVCALHAERTIAQRCLRPSQTSAGGRQDHGAAA